MTEHDMRARWIIVDADNNRQDGDTFATEAKANAYIMAHAPDRHADLFVVPDWSDAPGLKRG
jgi:hypothetical protein